MVGGRIANQALGNIVDALRDYDYMIEKQDFSKRSGQADPFEISSRRWFGYRIIKPLIPGHNPRRMDRNKDIERFKDGYNILPGFARGESNALRDQRDFLERLSLGLIGGLALIGPMVLMVLRNDLLTTLLTSSVMTVLFAAALAIWTSLKGAEVLGYVAAYAAVLVVFVGSSSATG